MSDFYVLQRNKGNGFEWYAERNYGRNVTNILYADRFENEEDALLCRPDGTWTVVHVTWFDMS